MFTREQVMRNETFHEANIIQRKKLKKEHFPFGQIFRSEIPGIHATSGTIFSGWLDNPSWAFQVSRENTKSNRGLFAFFTIIYLPWGCLTSSEVEINYVLGEDDNISFIEGI